MVVWILMGLPWVVEDGGGCACDNDLGFVTVVEKQGGGVFFFIFIILVEKEGARFYDCDGG